ncbi:hypothetical protein [Rhizobium sp. 21-4511-3d]
MSERRFDREQLLGTIFDLFPWTRQYRDEPIRHYAAALYDYRPAVADSTRREARNTLRRWVTKKALERGFGQAQAERLADDIDQYPVLQTGPHLHLLIEPDAFFTHLFSLMGLAALGSRSYISYACSTVKFAEKSRKGPGWLRLDGQAINVFGLSRREMIPYSILAKNQKYEFALKPAEGFSHPHDAIAALEPLLPAGPFPSAAAAIKAANLHLWNAHFDQHVDFLQLDDEDVSDLVLMHLDDPNSWLCRKFLIDPVLPVKILRTIDRLASTPWRDWLKNSTHFFWGCDHGRIFPMELGDGFLSPSNGEGDTIALTREGLMEALAAGRIIPNLLLVFIVIAILPGIRVLGGSRHTVYYPLMRYAFCAGLVDSGCDDNLLRSLVHERRASAWGHRVILETAEPFALLRSKSGAVPSLMSRYGAVSLDQACGSLDGFLEDPLWQDLSSSLKNGGVSTTGGPWAFV